MLKQTTQEELNKVLELHEKWLNDEDGGVRANLSYYDLTNKDLSGTDLTGTDLTNADLTGTDLTNADLTNTTLLNTDLRYTDLSGTKGLPSAIEIMNKYFEKTDEGYIAYKTFGEYYEPNPNWKIEIGEVIEENVNFNRTNSCGCGINVATLDWVKRGMSILNIPIYKVLIRNEWLMGVCVPYHTDGKIRCEKVEIIDIVKG